MLSEDQLREYLERTRTFGERLDHRDYFKRLWMAEYAGMNDMLGDALEELLDRQGEPIAFRALRVRA